SDLSHQAAADAPPLRDAFAVLFFVSVGMLFDPSVLLANPGRALAVLAIVIIVKPLVAFLIVATVGYPVRTGLVVAAGLAQIGEFSFILAELGRALGLLPEEGYSLVLVGALLSITLNPLLFRGIEPVERWLRGRPAVAAWLNRGGGALIAIPAQHDEDSLRGHAVLCGYGRVGSIIGQALERRGFTYVVVEQNRRQVEALRQRGVTALYGDAATPALLAHANVAQARLLVIAIPDPSGVRQIVEYAHSRNAHLDIVARTHSEREWAHLRDAGVGEAVLGERELALEMMRYALRRFGVSAIEVQATIAGLRR
ncbi:MAG: NAD-binding protein, partial [Chloroflexota bacterium]